MRIRIKVLGNGLHSSERVVEIRTTDGTVILTVDHTHLDDDGLEIGYPITRSKENWLVELPRETANGKWRVWVPGGEIADAPRMESVH
jgi:hypothetical protein